MQFAIAAAALAFYSIFLLDFTYLDPLPWRAGQLGVVLLLPVALGAGMLSGWQRRTMLLVPVCAVGVLVPSASLMADNRRWWSRLEGPEYGPHTDHVLFLLLLLPLAILLGALLRRLTGHGRSVGAVVLALPLVVVAWAGFRHIRPIDVHPAKAITISYPRYRGVALGERFPKVLAVLGAPDRQDGTIDLTYGRDTFELTPPDANFDAPEMNYRLVIVDVRSPRAETSEGVGIGDSLSLVRSRLRAPGRCYHDGTFRPYCYVYFDSAGLNQLEFIGDPIEQIRLT